MKRLIFILAFAVLCTVVSAQDIFESMPTGYGYGTATVTVNQSPELRNAMRRHISEATPKPVQGYRIRIFFSNAQNAREESIRVVDLFSSSYPGYRVYHRFVNPNFKVTVGNFRTRSDALVLLNAVKSEFPGAFIVKETIELNGD